MNSLKEISKVCCPACNTDSWQRQFRRQGFNFVECICCKLVRLDPLPTEKQLYEHYAQRAAAGNYEIAKSSERTPTLNGVFSYLQKFNTATAGKIFDAGCFDGGFLDIASRYGWETWGLELQGEACEAAKQKHPNTVFEGTLEQFKTFPENYFDACTAIGVIEHLLNPSSLLDFAGKALKHNGLLLIQTPNHGSIARRLLGPFWPCFAAPEHTFYFDANNLQKLCARHNFERIGQMSHWKPLRLGYAFEQFRNFGPEIYTITSPLSKILPRGILHTTFDLYCGEMLSVYKKLD